MTTLFGQFMFVLCLAYCDVAVPIDIAPFNIVLSYTVPKKRYFFIVSIKTAYLKATNIRNNDNNVKIA